MCLFFQKRNFREENNVHLNSMISVDNFSNAPIKRFVVAAGLQLYSIVSVTSYKRLLVRLGYQWKENAHYLSSSNKVLRISSFFSKNVGRDSNYLCKKLFVDVIQKRKKKRKKNPSPDEGKTRTYNMFWLLVI